MTNDVYLQPDSPDPVLDSELVLSLVRRHADAHEVRKVEESGGEARAYMVDDGIVLKVQRPHRLRPRTNLEKEVFFLSQLVRYSEINVPRVLGYGREADVEYICMTRMQGVAALSVRLTTEERNTLLVNLGSTLRRLHGIEQQPFRESALFPGDRTAADLRERLEFLVRQAAAAVQDDPSLWPLQVTPEDIGAKVMADLPDTARLVALHSNPGPEHVFVDPQTKRFTGLIDFGDAYLSHPAFDGRWPRPEDRAALMAGYESDGALDNDGLAAWQAVYTVSELTACTSPRSSAERRAIAWQNLQDLTKTF